MIKKWLLLVVLPLALGGLGYWLLRPAGSVPFISWLDVPPSPLGASNFTSFISRSWPSLIWSYALAMALLLIWRMPDKKATLLLSSIAFGVSVVFELAQRQDLMPGSFDWWDVLFSGLGVGSAALLFQKCLPAVEY